MFALDAWQFVGRVVASGYPGSPLPFEYTFTKPIIKVETDYIVRYSGQKNWYRAGWLQQLTAGINGAEIHSFLVPLNQSKLFFEMTRYSASYQIVFKPRSYLPNLSCSVYEWNGEWMPEVQAGDDGEVLNDGVF